MKPIVVEGKYYRSVAEAWRWVGRPKGISLVAVRWRLREGWNHTDALTIPTVPPEWRRRCPKDIRGVNNKVLMKP